MKTEIRAAFVASCQGYSADRVVADPALNALFVADCRNRGLTEPVMLLNRTLLNLRKGRGLRGLPPAIKTSFSDEDDYRFASEIVCRFLERRDGLTLDQIICDPEKAAEFDNVAAMIAPGHSSLQYRWAALNLRKLRKLRPEILGRALPAVQVLNIPVEGIDTKELPNQQGLYVFFCSSQVLYVGEARNLRNRIEKHLDHSDNRGLARWLWEQGNQEMHLELHVLPAATTTSVRRALEFELIASRCPRFNVQGT
ncbi:MAG: GIY-YIG nuclease family protein [Planctomycetales bacterium]